MITWKRRRKKKFRLFSSLIFPVFGSGQAYGVRLNKLCFQRVSNMMRSTVVGLSIFSFLAGIINGFNGFYKKKYWSAATTQYTSTQFIGMKNEWEKESLLWAQKKGKTVKNSSIRIRWRQTVGSFDIQVFDIFFFLIPSQSILFPFIDSIHLISKLLVIQVFFIFTRSSDALFVIVFTMEISTDIFGYECHVTIRDIHFSFWNRHGLHMEMESCWKCNFCLIHWDDIDLQHKKRNMWIDTKHPQYNHTNDIVVLLFHHKSILSKREKKKNERKWMIGIWFG